MPFISQTPPAEHRCIGTQRKKQESKNRLERTEQSSRKKKENKNSGRKRTICQSALTFDKVPPVRMDLNKVLLFSELKCIKPRE